MLLHDSRDGSWPLPPLLLPPPAHSSTAAASSGQGADDNYASSSSTDGAAAESGWPANLLEKDIWVVWALQTLGTEQQLLETLTFKRGTSLSKAYGLIDRFSEDVDPTLNIQHLWPEVDLAPAVNPSQAEKRRKAAVRKLKQWIREIPLPLLRVLPLQPVSPSSWFWSSPKQAAGSHSPSSSTANH